MCPFSGPGLYYFLFPILLTAEDWLLDLQAKPNPKRIENAPGPPRSDAGILALLVSGDLLDGHVKLVGKLAEPPLAMRTATSHPPMLRRS
jgi:hypothetical protein